MFYAACMKKFWMNLLKPKSGHAKWLIFATLVVVLLLGTAGHLGVIKQYLDTDQLTVHIGDFKMSAYAILISVSTVAVVFWSAAILLEFIEARVRSITSLRATSRTLILKIINIIVYVIAFLFSLDMVGIDLKALTIFSGALGIGLGFGLQKIASNFISGLILLLERAIEVGDLVELADGTFGFIRKARARYMLIETFDGKEILVPNEDFIVSRVVNWTFTSTQGRVSLNIGVSYDADVDLARELILEAAREHPRCINNPDPKCFLMNFGDSSVDFTLHFWVDDITYGRLEPHSEVMFAIWHKFKENGIEIPFPQRDLHIKSMPDKALVEGTVTAVDAPKKKKAAAKKSKATETTKTNKGGE